MESPAAKTTRPYFGMASRASARSRAARGAFSSRAAPGQQASIS